MKNHIEKDIIIIGGGMVGLACAAALAHLNLTVAIIEGNPPSPITDDYDLRVSAINPANINFFVELGIWPQLQKHRLSAYEAMHIWVDRSKLDFSAAEANLPELGFIIENNIMQHVLYEHVADQKNIAMYCPAKPTDIQIDEKVMLTLNNGLRIHAKLIIGADGHQSWLKKQIMPKELVRSYDHSALVAHIHTEKMHEKTAWQHFLPTGPLALLPLVDPHACSIVWSSNPEHIKELLACDENSFNQQLTNAFDNQLGKLTVTTQRLAFPLTLQHLEQYSSDHIAFIGDAAHRIHPLAGQGVNLGYQDVRCLARTIEATLNKKQDYWKKSALSAFERERQFHNQTMIKAVDAIRWIFSNPSSTLQTMRNIGIEKLNQNTFLKNILINLASGK